MRYRRRIRRYSKYPKKMGLLRRRKVKSKKSMLYAKKLIRKYSLPTAIKNVGMSEKKSYILRVIQPYTNAMAQGDATHHVYQIVLDPTLSPDFQKLYREETITVTKTVNAQQVNQQIHFNLFKYDYLRINKVLVVLRPITSTPNANITTVAANDQLGQQQYPASPIFGYYTIKNPMVFDDEIPANIETTYSINPQYDKICLEGKNKQVFSFPSNKSLTLNLNTIKFRCNNLSPCVLGNKLWDTQNIGPCQYNANQFYSIFGQPIVRRLTRANDNEDSNEESIQENNSEMDDDDEPLRGDAVANGIDVDAADQKAYSLNAGRIVLISRNPYKFTYEIYYHVSCYR